MSKTYRIVFQHVRTRTAIVEIEQGDPWDLAPTDIADHEWEGDWQVESLSEEVAEVAALYGPKASHLGLTATPNKQDEEK